MSNAVARALTVVTFLLLNVAMQIVWICFAPVTRATQTYFGVDELSVGWLAMLFMFVYVPVSLPAAWAIDVLGFKRAVSIGAVLLGSFAVLRAEMTTFVGAVACTVALAIAQPFLLNAFTKLAALWFAPKHRATVTGVAFLATFVGVAVGESVTADLVSAYGMLGMQRCYGGFAALCALMFIVLARNPAGAGGDDERALVTQGLVSMLKRKDMWLLALALFVGNGVMNGVSTWVQGVVVERGVPAAQAGDLAAWMLIGGVVGALALPALSDRWQRRKPVLVAAFTLAIPSLACVPLSSSVLMLGTAFFCIGVFTIGAAPVAYQYAVEVTSPTPVGTSNGVLALVGQASVIVIFAMGAWKEHAGSWSPPLWAAVGAVAVSAVALLGLRESPIAGANKNAPG